jgi:hypothetical protein
MSNKYLLRFRFFRTFAFVLLSGVTLLIYGCGGGGSSPDNTQPPLDTTVQVPAEITSLVNNMTLMASVTDPDGVPIVGALVGDSEFTGADGVVMGAIQPATSGWYSVSAPGYAQEYIKPLGSYQGKTSFATRLTPVGSIQSWTMAAATPVTVIVGEVPDPVLSVAFGATAFSSDVTLSVTMLDPVRTNTTLAALDTMETLYITHPFEVRAQDNNGQDQQMAAGESAQVTISDNGDMGAVPRLFWFNPDTGIWQEQLSAGCTRLDATHVQCLLSHFSQHGGASSSPPASAPPNDPHSAGRDTNKEFNDWENSGDTSGGLPDPLLDALTTELIAAIAWADGHPSEEAKTLLVNTYGRLQILGYDSYNHKDDNGVIRDTDELIAAIERVLTKLADPHIKNPQCFNFEKIEHLTVQAAYLGFEELENKLITVYNQLIETCNVIHGRVEYSVVLASDVGWPSSGPYSKTPRESGASYWTEYNDINLVIHANDAGDAVEVDGSVNVETDFPQVVYRREVNDMGYCSFDTFERESYWGEPNKGMLEVTVQAQADLAGLQYSNEMLTSSSSISIQYKSFTLGWALEGYPSPVCVKDDDAEAVIALWENYQGQVMEQYKESQYLESSGEELGSAFFTWTGERMPTVWDILDEEPDVTRPGPGDEDSYPTRIWRGSEILFDVLNIPSGEYGHKVIMRWDLQHIDYTRGKWVKLHK